MINAAVSNATTEAVVHERRLTFLFFFGGGGMWYKNAQLDRPIETPNSDQSEQRECLKSDYWPMKIYIRAQNQITGSARPRLCLRNSVLQIPREDCLYKLLAYLP